MSSFVGCVAGYNYVNTVSEPMPDCNGEIVFFSDVEKKEIANLLLSHLESLGNRKMYVASIGNIPVFKLCTTA